VEGGDRVAIMSAQVARLRLCFLNVFVFICTLDAFENSLNNATKRK